MNLRLGEESGWLHACQVSRRMLLTGEASNCIAVLHFKIRHDWLFGPVRLLIMRTQEWRGMWCAFWLRCKGSCKMNWGYIFTYCFVWSVCVEKGLTYRFIAVHDTCSETRSHTSKSKLDLTWWPHGSANFQIEVVWHQVSLHSKAFTSLTRPYGKMV